MKTAISLILLKLALSGVLAAQTFTQSGQFTCDAASAHPIQYAYQFTCRGVPLLDSYGNPAGNGFFSVSYNYFRVNLSGFPSPDSNTSISRIDSFTVPSDSAPGTIQFEAVFTDANNVTHNATVSATWVDHVICGGRGCYWHNPLLLTSTTTIQ
jgi:hypothetical protein